jgi:hypothetical protein
MAMTNHVEYQLSEDGSIRIDSLSLERSDFVKLQREAVDLVIEIQAMLPRQPTQEPSR